MKKHAPETAAVEIQVQRAEPLHEQVRRQLEQAIRSGRLAEGERLPPTSQLVKRWGVNYSALQRAMDHLSAAGLVERKPGRGTFVRSAGDRPVIGVLVGPSLLDGIAHFWRALVQAMQEEVAARGYRCLCYDRFSQAAPDALTESQQHLFHDIRDHRFKGLVLLGFGESRVSHELVEAGLPMAILTSNPRPPGPSVTYDRRDFVHTALTHLATRGQKRVVYLHGGSPRDDPQRSDVDGFLTVAAACGLKVNAGSISEVGWIPDSRLSSVERAGYERMMALLSACDSRGKRPDGLIVSDDILMRGVALALVERGVRVPEDMEIVCSGNEGGDHFYAVPVWRYLYSPAETVRAMVSLLWQQMVGETLPSLPVMIKGRLSDAVR